MQQEASASARQKRLRRGRDFQLVMRRGRHARNRLVHVAVRDNSLGYSRVGFSVSKRVGIATTRNRVKRRLRAIVRDLPIASGYDVVGIALSGSENASYQDLFSAIKRCMAKIDALD